MQVSMIWPVELIVNGVTGGNNATTFNFPDQPYLNDKPVQWIEIFSVNDISVAPSNTPLVASTVIKTATLTLYMNNPDQPESQGQWITNVPLWQLHQIQNATDPFCRHVFEMRGQKIVWTKSFITVGAAIANTTNVSFFFNVGYWDPK